MDGRTRSSKGIQERVQRGLGCYDGSLPLDYDRTDLRDSQHFPTFGIDLEILTESGSTDEHTISSPPKAFSQLVHQGRLDSLHAQSWGVGDPGDFGCGSLPSMRTVPMLCDSEAMLFYP